MFTSSPLPRRIYLHSVKHPHCSSFGGTIRTRKVDRFFLTGDYINVHDNSNLMKTNIHFKTFTWSSICCNHIANHSHEWGWGRGVVEIIWPIGIRDLTWYIEYRQIPKKSVCAIYKKIVLLQTNNCLNFYKNCTYVCLNSMHNKMCALLLKKCVYFYTKSVYTILFWHTYSLIKISPLQYQNAFYAPELNILFRINWDP